MRKPTVVNSDNGNTTDPQADPHVFQIMGRIHVNTPDDEALIHAVKSLRSVGTIAANQLFYYAGRCLTAHHINAGLYRHVMGGMK